MLEVDEVIGRARRAKERGATRFCMGAAWREVKDGPAFDRVLEMVRGVKELGLEACVTLGMLTTTQARAPQGSRARRLQPQPRHLARALPIDHHDAHLRRPPAHARNVREAGITVCSGGIIGMGESIDDRCAMLVELARLEPHPESVPDQRARARRRDAARSDARRSIRSSSCA